MKVKLTECQGEVENSINRVRNFNSFISKIKKEIENQ